MALKSLVDLSKEQFGTTVEFEFHVKEKFFLDPTGIMDQHEYGQYLEYADLKKVREVISLEENFYSLKSFFKILHEPKSKDRYKDEIAIFLVKTAYCFFLSKVASSQRLVKVFSLRRSVSEFKKIQKALFFIKKFKK